ncbi:hypothetical protein ACQBAR_07455 [Propionibacteriaceae bacterium Y1685]
MTSSSTMRAPALFPAAVLCFLEGLAAFAFGVLELVQTQPQRPVVGITTGIAMIAYGALLVVVGNGLRRARGWSRGPAVATQILQLPIALSFVGGSTTWFAVLLALASIAVLVCVFLPRSTYALTGTGHGPPGQR